MSNHLGMRFNNSMDGFKYWTRTFPPLDPHAVKKTGYKKSGDYYLEVQLVQGFITENAFVSPNVYKYNAEDADFEHVYGEEKERLLATVFKQKVADFEAKHLSAR